MTSYDPQQPAGYNPPTAPPPYGDGPPPGPPHGPPGMPPPGPPPGPPGPPAPPPKKKKTGLVVGLVVGGLALVLLCVGGGIGAFLYFMPEEEPDPQFRGDYSVYDDEVCTELSLDGYEALVGEYTMTDSSAAELSKYSNARLECSYDVPSDEEFYLLQIRAEVYSSAPDAESSFDSASEHDELDAGGDWTLEPDAGFGESSHWKYMDPPEEVHVGTLRVWDDNLHLEVSLSPGGDFDFDTTQAVTSGAAEEIMTALGGEV